MPLAIDIPRRAVPPARRAQGRDIRGRIRAGVQGRVPAVLPVVVVALVAVAVVLALVAGAGIADAAPSPTPPPTPLPPTPLPATPAPSPFDPGGVGAPAAPGQPGTPGATAPGGVMANLVFAPMMAFFQQVVGGALVKIVQIVGATLLTTPTPDQLPHLGEMWEGSRLIAVSLYLLVFLLAGVMLMGHETVQTRYALREALPRLVMGFLALNLSLWGIGQAVTMANALSAAIVGDAVTPAAVAQTVLQLVTVASDPTWLVFLQLALLIMFVMLLVGYVLRLAMFAILVVAAPLALAAHGLPHTEPLARWWWRAFGAMLGVQLAQSLTLAVSLRIFFTPGAHIVGTGDSTAGLIVWLTTLVILIKIPGWGFRALRIGNGGSLVKTAVRAVVAVGTAAVIAGTGGTGAAAAGAATRAVGGKSGMIIRTLLGGTTARTRDRRPPTPRQNPPRPRPPQQRPAQQRPAQQEPPRQNPADQNPPGQNLPGQRPPTQQPPRPAPADQGPTAHSPTGQGRTGTQPPATHQRPGPARPPQRPSAPSGPIVPGNGRDVPPAAPPPASPQPGTSRRPSQRPAPQPPRPPRPSSPPSPPPARRPASTPPPAPPSPGPARPPRPEPPATATPPQAPHPPAPLPSARRSARPPVPPRRPPTPPQVPPPVPPPARPPIRPPVPPPVVPPIRPRRPRRPGGGDRA